jgi:hypothetical protein
MRASGTSTTMAVLKAVRPDVPFDRAGLPASDALLLVPCVTTHTGNLRSIAELVAYAKQNPGKVTYGSQGIGSPGHFQGAMLEAAVGVQMLHVPYKGGIAMILDMVAQRVDIGFNTWSATKEYVRAGKLRYLAVIEKARRSEEPGVPTLAELGIHGVEHDVWSGLFVPAKTPDAIVSKLNQEFVRAARARGRETTERRGFLIHAGTSDELRRHLAAESETRAAVRKFGIQGTERHCLRNRPAVARRIQQSLRSFAAGLTPLKFARRTKCCFDVAAGLPVAEYQ